MTECEMAALCEVLALDAAAASWGITEVSRDPYARAFEIPVYATSQLRLADYRTIHPAA